MLPIQFDMPFRNAFLASNISDSVIAGLFHRLVKVPFHYLQNRSESLRLHSDLADLNFLNDYTDYLDMATF